MSLLPKKTKNDSKIGQEKKLKKKVVSCFSICVDFEKIEFYPLLKNSRKVKLQKCANQGKREITHS